MDYEKKYKEALDKAKRYDEVFNAAKEWYNNPNSSSIGKAYLYAVFPELRESEDEKIRKVLVNYFKTYKEQEECGVKTFYGIPTDKILAWLEKQGEQKPANKVAPKFHEGEWLCENEPNNYARFIQILEIVNVQGKERYRISRDIHNDEDIVEFDFVEKYYHKFGIKDAKDGDILASKSGNKIFSYRGNLDLRGNPCAYYGIYKVHDGICFSPCAIGNSFTYEEVVPATKEQRELLFEEKTAAGGVLHFNKKELNWKPSDEQMDALQYVCRNLNPPLSDKLGWDSLKTLELLYQDLKKL